jgi:hypothetical protein
MFQKDFGVAVAIAQGLKPLLLSLFPARLKFHPIDEDLSMGTPVKPCPDTKRVFETRSTY